MPLSKNGKLYFTEDQLKYAKAHANALRYAQNAGYNLIKQGHYYIMNEHDSMVFKEDGSWFWNSRNLHGDALDFMVEYEGKTLCEAVLTLTNPSYSLNTSRNCVDTAPPSGTSAPSKEAFRLPDKSSSNKQLYGYLCGTRKLDPDIVRKMIDQKILYQSEKKLPDGHFIHNACFVTYDNNHQPCAVFQRGLLPKSQFKGEVPGGNKEYGWLFHGTFPTTLYVFEAAIDAASFLTIGKKYKIDYLNGSDLLALGGLSSVPITTYLHSHPHIKKVILMLDNDNPGQSAVHRIQQELPSTLLFESFIPPTGKDWNEYLQSFSV